MEENNVFIADIYSYIREFAMLKLDSQTKREDSLILQSSHMQTAFSFTTAALFMIAPIVTEYRGKMSLEFLLLVFSSITFFLILSLWFASKAQNRRYNTVFPDVEIFTEHVENNYKYYLTREQREKAMAAMIGEVQKSKDKTNNIKVKQIKLSMCFFYTALSLSIFWFIVSLIIMYI